MIKLIGVLIVVVAGMDFMSILSTLGKAFVDSRYMSIFLLSLPL